MLQSNMPQYYDSRNALTLWEYLVLDLLNANPNMCRSFGQVYHSLLVWRSNNRNFNSPQSDEDRKFRYAAPCSALITK